MINQSGHMKEVHVKSAAILKTKGSLVMHFVWKTNRIKKAEAAVVLVVLVVVPFTMRQ